MIKGIIFDWFGVCTTENWSNCVERELLKKLDIRKGEMYKPFKAFLQDLMNTKLSPEQFLDKLIGALDPSQDPKEFYYLIKIVPDLNEDLLKFIRELKKKHKVYLLSNTIAKWFEIYQKKLNFDEHFDMLFLSHILKISKTDDRIWDKVLSKVPFKPSELVFIDNKESYLEVARKRGVNTILFKSNEQVKRDLKKALK